MAIPSDLSVLARRQFYRRAALAPICLCLVAGLHLVRVAISRQTPWKGGGFGMFSTIDDESARFLRCYLMTGDGDLPLPIPPPAAKAAAELRAAPSQKSLDDFARRLAQQSWRWHGEQVARQSAVIQRRGGICITAAVFRELTAPDKYSPGSADYIEPIPRDEPPAGAISFHAVRVECLRYRYRASARQLIVQPILTAVHRPPLAPSEPRR